MKDDKATQQSAQVIQDVVPHTPPEQATTLTAEENTFCSLVSKGYSATTAYRKAFPAKANLTYNTVRVYASELLAKTYISSEVATKTEKAAKLARLAEERLEDILINDDSQAKGNKVADVAMFMYDHANGKATQRIEQRTEAITLNIDLTGEGTPVLDQ